MLKSKPKTSGVNNSTFALGQTGSVKGKADGDGNNFGTFSLERNDIPHASKTVNQPKHFAFGSGQLAKVTK